mgnify:CR=1 FL=1
MTMLDIKPEGSCRYDLIALGEIMLRLSPPGFERLFQSPLLQATFGGGEANVAVALAQFGIDARYVTLLPARTTKTTSPAYQKMKARLQCRQGAGILQPYRDLWKLLRKGKVQADTASGFFGSIPVLVLAFSGDRQPEHIFVWLLAFTGPSKMNSDRQLLVTA